MENSRPKYRVAGIYTALSVWQHGFCCFEIGIVWNCGKSVVTDPPWWNKEIKA